MALVAAAATVARILLLRDGFDLLRDVESGAPFPTSRLAAIALGLALVVLAIGVARMVEYRLTDRLGRRHVHEWRVYGLGHLVGATNPPGPSQMGSVVARFSADLSAIRGWVTNGLGRGTAAAVTTVVAVGCVAALDSALGATLVGCLAIGLASSLRAGAAVGGHSVDVRRRRGRLANRVMDLAHDAEVVRLFGRIEGELSRVEALSAEVVDAQRELTRASSRVRFGGDLASAMSTTLLLVVGALRIGTGHTTVGTVVASVLVARQLTGSARLLARAWDLRQRALVQRARLLSSIERYDAGFRHRDRAANGRLRLQGLMTRSISEPVDLEVPPRRRLAVLAQDDAARELLDVLAGIGRPSRGVVRLGGVEIERLAKRHVGVVGSRWPLLAGSIERAIGYGIRSSDRADLFERLGDRELVRVVGTLEQGERTRISRGAPELEPELRRRLELARATLTRPRLLLLDRPTDGLQADAAERLWEVIDEVRATVVFTTSHPHEAIRADQILLLDWNGGHRLVAPSDLLAGADA